MGPRSNGLGRGMGGRTGEAGPRVGPLYVVFVGL